ncbi:uncharacterized protein LOC108113806 [Drosophila eugracilis]|uniref:uncharacterized protein LOC108113806 n=1 Tax=Drosophila eugracilis TaxID=29029 RepID=UPI001BDB6CB6|nr:uncharacterized protein LOC108113806 [Drosophila eugracilis]
MELNTDNPSNEVSVLAPNDQENEDANLNLETLDAVGTPMAKKTRRAVLKRMNATSEKDSPTHPDPPKTPGSPGHVRPTTETPRRSCRKSVRPPIDYDDIVRSAKKVLVEASTDDPENEEPSTQKWSAAEVGKNTRKRSRKSKRVASKKQKTDQVVFEENVGEVQDTEMEIPKENVEKPQDQVKITEVQADNEEVKQRKSIRKSTKTSKNQVQPRKQNFEEQEPSKYIVADAEKDELGLCLLDMDDNDKEETNIKAGESAETAPKKKDENVVVQDRAQFSTDEKVDETTKPLTPIKQKINTVEDSLSVVQSAEAANVIDEQSPEEEMPSLFMESEDLNGPEKSPLNTTFDAEDKKDLDASVILVVSPLQQPEAKASNIDASVILVDSPEQSEICAPKPEISEEKSEIKVVLTTEDDQDQVLLDLNDISSPKELNPRKSKGYRFPTPYKTGTIFKFTKTPEAVSKHNIKTFFEEDVSVTKNVRKRSKSTSQLNDNVSRTVSFQSPIEIAHVEDIDKRWKGLQKNNVNNRRRRSKSLDENRCKISRIPKPSKGVILVNRTNTPSQVNKRTKMPNFAAMHEKQFARMESLLDHVERKAERAKVLTNSVQKQPGSTSKKPQISASVEEGTRPRAMKKIDMTANRSMVMEHSTDKLNSSRLPLKTTAPVLNVVPKPAFNLSTSMVKTFNATFSSRPVESHDTKLAERRQRRIEMFKGRTTKDQKEKAEFIRGVRLNRRFELQMQHRRHLEED